MLFDGNGLMVSLSSHRPPEHRASERPAMSERFPPLAPPPKPLGRLRAQLLKALPLVGPCICLLIVLALLLA